MLSGAVWTQLEKVICCQFLDTEQLSEVIESELGKVSAVLSIEHWIVEGCSEGGRGVSLSVLEKLVLTELFYPGHKALAACRH